MFADIVAVELGVIQQSLQPLLSMHAMHSFHLQQQSPSYGSKIYLVN